MPEKIKERTPEKFRGQHEFFDSVSAFLLVGGIWLMAIAFLEYEIGYIWPVHKFLAGAALLLLGWLM